MGRSQSPQIGALSPSRLKRPDMRPGPCLNPLKSGLCLRRQGSISGRLCGVWSQSPQIGALSPSMRKECKHIKLVSLNPLKSGLCLRPLGFLNKLTTEDRLNPLKSGLCLRPRATTRAKTRATARSQSPQIGALSPSHCYRKVSEAEKTMSQSPQIGALSPSWCRELGTEGQDHVSIPSNRGSVSVPCTANRGCSRVLEADSDHIPVFETPSTRIRLPVSPTK